MRVVRVIVNIILVTLHTIFRSFIVNICTLYCIIPIIIRFSEELLVQDDISHLCLNLYFGLWYCKSTPTVGTKHDLTAPDSTWQYLTGSVTSFSPHHHVRRSQVGARALSAARLGATEPILLVEAGERERRGADGWLETLHHQTTVWHRPVRRFRDFQLNINKANRTGVNKAKSLPVAVESPCHFYIDILLLHYLDFSFLSSVMFLHVFTPVTRSENVYIHCT